ncbi:MAG: glycosyltransferase [Myxococcales bacterium]|nr:glycosyltransferase [Myxococcales bacterium]
MIADVVVPVFRDLEATRSCLRSVLGHSGESLGQLIVVNDASPEEGMAALLEEVRASDPRVVLLQNERNLGFVRSCNRGLALACRDMVLLNSDTVATEGWLRELLEVGHSSERVAAAVPLSNNGTLCSVPSWCAATDHRVLEGAELRLQDCEPRWTEMPTGVGFCILMRHHVFKMIGGLDPAFGRGYHEENDWCQRARQHGFVVLRANRALVFHLGGASFGAERERLDRLHARLLCHRYPHFLEQTREFERGPEARVAAAYVRRRLGKFSVRLEAAPSELREALGRRPEVELTAGEAEVQHAADGLHRVEHLRRFLGATGHTVLGGLDLLAFRTVAGASSRRSLQYSAAQAAQAVIARSEFERHELLGLLLLRPERVHTVHPGVSNALAERDAEKNRVTLERLGLAPPYFLFTASDGPHDNLKLLLAAYALFRGASHDGEPPALVVAARPVSGGLLERIRHWPPGVRHLDELAPEDRRSVIQEAVALVCPSAYSPWPIDALEGMAAGVPIVASRLAAIPEVAGDAALYLDEPSPEELATRLAEIGASEELRARLSAAGKDRARRYSWEDSAQRTVEVYLDVIERPDPATLTARQMLSGLVRAVARRPGGA